MSDSLEMLRRHSAARSIPGQAPAVTLAEPDDELACPAFGYLRGQKERALAIELRRVREGDSVSFPYHWLGPTRYHPSLGISLLFAGSELYLVAIRGRNLNKLTETGISLYELGILRARITWLREMKREESESLPRTECVVESIEVRVVSAETAARAFGLGQDGL